MTCPSGVPLCISRCVILKTTDKTHSHTCAFRVFYTFHTQVPIWFGNLRDYLKVKVYSSWFGHLFVEKHFQHMQPGHNCSASLRSCFYFSIQTLPCVPFLSNPWNSRNRKCTACRTNNCPTSTRRKEERVRGKNRVWESIGAVKPQEWKEKGQILTLQPETRAFETNRKRWGLCWH